MTTEVKPASGGVRESEVDEPEGHLRDELDDLCAAGLAVDAGISFIPFIAVYLVWMAVVVFVFPPLFGFQ